MVVESIPVSSSTLPIDPSPPVAIFRTYASYVDQLAEDHIHLQCLSDFLYSRPPGSLRRTTPATPHPETDWLRQRMMILDVFRDDETSPNTSSLGSRTLLQRFPSSREGTGFLSQLLREPAPNITSRTIVIDAPTPQNISLLGEVYDIDPTFFYNHIEAQAWNYWRWADAPDHLVTHANPLRSMRWVHVDIERLHAVRVDMKVAGVMDPERFSGLLRGFVDGLSSRMASAMDLVPKMRIVYTGRLRANEPVQFVSRGRISLYCCVQGGVNTNIFLLYPSVASRKYSYHPTLLPEENDNRIHSLSNHPLPKFSHGHTVQYESSGCAGTAAQRLLRLLQGWHRQHNSTSTPIVPLMELVGQEWAMTLANLQHLMQRFEADATLLTPAVENAHFNISLDTLKHLLYEYRDILTTTLRRYAPDHPELTAHLHTVATLLERAESAGNAHTGLMAIEESRKAIAQAESVRRLTNLAFLFLPLSLTTGIYGMNVAEFEGAVRAWVVVATGVVTTTVAVAVAVNWHRVMRLLLFTWYLLLWPAEALGWVRRRT